MLPPGLLGGPSGEARRFRSTEGEKGWRVLLGTVWSYMCAWLYLHRCQRPSLLYAAEMLCSLCSQGLFQRNFVQNQGGWNQLCSWPGMSARSAEEWIVLRLWGSVSQWGAHIAPLFLMHFIPLSLGYLLNVLDVSCMQKGLWAVSTWANKIISALPVVWTDEIERSDDRTLGWGGTSVWEAGKGSHKHLSCPLRNGNEDNERRERRAFRGKRINMGNHCTAGSYALLYMKSGQLDAHLLSVLQMPLKWWEELILSQCPRASWMRNPLPIGRARNETCLKLAVGMNKMAALVDSAWHHSALAHFALLSPKSNPTTMQ